MERKVAVVYTVFSILAFIALTTWFAFAFFQTKADNLIAAANTFVDVKNSVGIAVNTRGDLKTPSVREYIRSLFLQDPSVDLVSISSPKGDVLYIYSRHASYLVPPLVQKDRFVGSIRYSKMTQRLFTAELSPPNERTTPDRISAVFTVLSRNDIYSLTRIVLISLIAFVILTGIVILILPLLRRDGRDGAHQATVPPHDAAEHTRMPETESDHDDRSGETEGTESPPSQSRMNAPLNELPKGTSAIVLPEPPGTSAEPPQTPSPTAADRQATDSASQPRVESPVLPEETEIEEVDLYRAEQSPAQQESGSKHELPDEVQLPALSEVLGEDPELSGELPEIALFSGIDEETEPADHVPDSTAVLEPDGDLEIVEDEPSEPAPPKGKPAPSVSDDLALEVTEIEEHATGQEPGDRENGTYQSSGDELEDIDDFEDLEALDGHVSQEPPDPVVRRRPDPPSPESKPPQEKQAEPPTAPGEPEELLEIAEETQVPEESGSAPPPSPPFIELSPEEEIILETPESLNSMSELDIYESEGVALDEPLASSDIEELELVEIGGSNAAGERSPDSAAVSTESPIPTQPPEGRAGQSVPAESAEASGRSSRDLFNPQSGLAWGDHLEQRLSFELDRAASFDQDLSLALIKFDSPVSLDIRLSYANDIRGYFPFRDLCFEQGEDAFAIVMPNSDIDQAIRTMDNFNTREAEERPNAPRVFIGLSARNGRLLGGERLLTEAETAAAKAREDGQNAIFALRVDPGKYREYIKSTLK